jgi:cytoskeletal protein CcmA (bactofilin family)
VTFAPVAPAAPSPAAPPAMASYRQDFDRTDLYSDDKTIISKNTVIRGAVQTEDSIRLLGQVHGDIDCKSNIVVAGKVRGNTTAANAYVMDAQIDGNMQCEDVVSVSSDAWVLGNIRAQQAEIDGKIKGNLDIRHAISIGSTSSIIGNISTDELEIKRGEFINGQIMMYTPSRDLLDRFDQFED